MSYQIKVPGTADGGAGTYEWTGMFPSYVQYDEGTDVVAVNHDAVSAHDSEFLTCTNFGFTVSDPIQSVYANIRRRRLAADGGTITDSEVKLLLAGTPSGGDLAAAGDWPDSFAYANYNLDPGGTLTAADINSSGFGVRISAALAAALMVETQASIDHVQITVNYGDIVPPPPHPGSGGLNVGGTFWLMMCAQGLLFAMGLAGRGITLHQHSAAITAMTIAGSVQPSRNGDHIPVATQRMAVRIGPERGVCNRLCRLFTHCQQSTDQRGTRHNHRPKRHASPRLLAHGGQPVHCDSS